MPLNLERIVEQMSRVATAANEPQVRDILRYMEETERRLRHELRVGWPDATDSSRIFQEARARSFLDQLEPAIAGLRVSQPGTPVYEATRDAIMVGREQASAQTREFLELIGEQSGVPYSAAEMQEMIAFSTQINFDAVQAQVQNAAARLHRYEEQTIDKVNQAVVNGMITGSGWRGPAMEIRQALIGDPKGNPLYDETGRRLVQGSGGLAFQAETIARTEMISSLQDARDTYYDQMNVEMGIWWATEDERTCRFCGARSGQIYRRDQVIIPAHPRCRCALSPFRWEWVAMGIIDLDELAEHRASVLTEFRKEHGEDARFATGPSPFEKAAGMTEAPEPVDLSMLEREPPPASWAGFTPEPGTDMGQLVLPEAADLPAERIGQLVERPDGFLSGHDAFLALAGVEPAPEHVEVLEKYQSIQYISLNQFLRGETNELGEWTPEEVALLLEATRSQLLPADMELHRFSLIPSSVLGGDVDKLVGTVISNDMFVSTTVSEDMAEVISVRGGEGQDADEYAVFLVIEAPAGTPGAFIPTDEPWIEGEDLVDAIMEGQIGRGYEVVLPPGTEFVITAVEQLSDDSLRIVVTPQQAEMLPRPLLEVVDMIPPIGGMEAFEEEMARQFETEATREASAIPVPDGGPLGTALYGHPLYELAEKLIDPDETGHLTEAELEALSFYTQDARPYTYFMATGQNPDFDEDAEKPEHLTDEQWENVKLSNQESRDWMVENIAILEGMFEHELATLPTDTVLYRGLTLPAGQIPQDLSKAVGTVIDNPGFVSTSLERDVAVGFAATMGALPGFGAGEWASEERAPYILEIHAPAGTDAVPLLSFEELTAFPDQAEVMLRNGIQFEVIGVRDEDGPIPTLVVRPVGEEVVREPASALVPHPLTPEALTAVQQYTSNSALYRDIFQEAEALGTRDPETILRERVEATLRENPYAQTWEEIPQETKERFTEYIENAFLLEELVASSALDVEVPLYRGMSIPTDQLPEDLQKLVGTTIPGSNVAGFASSTHDRETALSFAQGALRNISLGEGAETPVVVRIQPQPGEVGLRVYENSVQPQQQEVILPRGTEFEVRSALWDNGVVYLDVVVAPATPVEEAVPQAPLYSREQIEAVTGGSPFQTRMVEQYLAGNVGDVPRHALRSVEEDVARLRGEEVASRLPVTAAFTAVPASPSPVGLSEAASELRNRLTQEQQEVLHAYTEMSFDINAHLRGNYVTNPARTEREVEQLNEIFGRPDAVLPQDVVLYRAAAIPENQLSDEPGKLVGSIINDPAFLSTSVSREVAEEFLETALSMQQIGQGAGTMPVMMEISAPAGTRGIPLMEALAIQDYAHQQEVLLGRGTPMEVTSAQTRFDRDTGEAYLFLQVRPVPPAEEFEPLLPQEQQQQESRFPYESPPFDPLERGAATRLREQATYMFDDYREQAGQEGDRSGFQSIAALHYYSNQGYADINSMLRGAGGAALHATEDLAERIEAIDRAFEHPRAVMPVDATLYRGYRLPTTSIPSDVSQLVGTEMTDSAFVSTSLKESVAEGFLEPDPDRVTVLAEIRAREGMPAVPVLGLGHAANLDEDEVLLPRGSRFVVAEAAMELGAYESENVLRLVLDYLPPPITQQQPGVDPLRAELLSTPQDEVMPLLGNSLDQYNLVMDYITDPSSVSAGRRPEAERLLALLRLARP